MANFIDVKSMQEVRNLLTTNEYNVLNKVLTQLATDKGCNQFAISVKPDELFLGEVRQGMALVYGVNANKFKFTVTVRFGRFDGNIGTPEVRDLRWMEDRDIEIRYPVTFNAIRYSMVPRRIGRVAFWNRVR